MEDVIGALPKKLENAKEFKTKIEEHFQGSSMANASMHAKYDGHGSVREHILNLKDLEMPLPEPYLVDYIMLSLHAIFDNFKINYNGSDNKWTLAELIAKCKMTENKDFVNFVSQDLGKKILVMKNLLESLLTTRKGRVRSLMMLSRIMLLKMGCRLKKVICAWIETSI
jgi:hypothetical protein